MALCPRSGCSAASKAGWGGGLAVSCEPCPGPWFTFSHCCAPMPLTLPVFLFPFQPQPTAEEAPGPAVPFHLALGDQG